MPRSPLPNCSVPDVLAIGVLIGVLLLLALLELLSSPHAATKAANEAATPVPPAMRRNFFREVGSDASSGTGLGASGICIAPLKLCDAGACAARAPADASAGGVGAQARVIRSRVSAAKGAC